jgi:prophage regulatory protein
MAKRIITHAQLADKGIRFSKVHMWRLERDGKFPRRVRTGQNRYGYLEQEVEDWIDERIAERDAALAARA